MNQHPEISLVLFVDTEKDERLIDCFFYSLRQWNADAMNDVDVTVVTQKRTDPHTLQVLADQPFPVDVVFARHPFAGKYPIWNVMETMQRISPMLRGRYVYPCHCEFLHCPGRLGKTVEYLKEMSPDVAVGNLRRPGDRSKSVKDWMRYRCSGEISNAIRREICEKDGDGRAHEMVEDIPTINWAYWRPEGVPGTVTRWEEDVFLARKDWLDATAFWSHADRLFFQDLYDLIGEMVKELKLRREHPIVERMSQQVHRVIHLWHPKDWDAWRPEIRDWFRKDPGRWEGTRYLDDGLWDRLIETRKEKWVTQQPVVDSRRSPGGTVTRYVQNMCDYLDSPEGAENVRRFRQKRLMEECSA